MIIRFWKRIKPLQKHAECHRRLEEFETGSNIQGNENQILVQQKAEWTELAIFELDQ